MEQELSARESDVQELESAFKGKVQGLDGASQEVKTLASNAAKKFENVVTILAFVVSKSLYGSFDLSVYHSDSIDKKLNCINASCGHLASLYSPLSGLYSDLKEIMRRANDMNSAVQR